MPANVSISAATAPSGSDGSAASPFEHPRGLFCNRTLNLRKIKAVGYDMDYTLVHYHVELWEERAHAYVRAGLAAQGWPVEELEFHPDLVMPGLIVDTRLGNMVKANRFGYVKRAFHGTHPLDYEDVRAAYRRVLVDLHDSRWQFMNTLFSISEAGIYLQLVDMLDEGRLPPGIGYTELYRTVRRTLDEAHLEGLLKKEILDDPGRFIDLDPDIPLTLLDQKEAGKKVLLITNSEWSYASPILSHCFDPFLRDGMTWRDIFDLAIVGARKPAFFSERAPAFEVVSDDGLLRAHTGPLREGHAYVGGHAALVEASLGVLGDQMLYVGDHVYADVKASSALQRWRTALVIRGLEDEIAAADRFRADAERLSAMMEDKESLEAQFSALRLERQRNTRRYGPQTRRSARELDEMMQELRGRLVALDEEIGGLARSSSRLMNQRWGPMLRDGADKTHLAHQIELSADVYTARVSNFLSYSPFVFLRARGGTLPHDEASPRDPGSEESGQPAA